MKQELKKDFIKRIEEYIDEEDRLLIYKALDFACDKLSGYKTFDKKAYINHILRSTITLTKLHSDRDTIISGLINWIPVLNKTVSLEDIEKQFGYDVKKITESLMKINKLRLQKDDAESTMYLRKVLVGLSTDVRVIIIKLAERLDNLKYVYVKPCEEQRQKALETENVLIPIAHRLGINYIKSELEDLCLRYLKPDIYKEIEDELDTTRNELTARLEEMKDELSEMIAENNIKFRIKARVKSVHSIYSKLSKGKKMSQIYDILALRIITNKVSDCYQIIGLIHAKYKSLPNRFKDYIAKPKENMYQSLHTGIVGLDGSIFEVQIRTEEMDEIAEHGIASHWSYKEKGSKMIQNLMEQKLELFRSSIDINGDKQEIEDDFKDNFINEMIYVYTPKGDVIELPKDSTPVDFAYKVHSHVGDTMVGAFVNDQMVSIDTKLNNDDIVNIKTSNNSSPKKEWLNFVKTNQAKNKIKAFFSKQDRERYIEKGERLLEREIRKRKWSINDTLTKDNINKLVDTLKLKDYDDLKLSIGSLRYTASYVMSLLVEDKHDISDVILEKITSHVKDTNNYKNDIIVAGCDDILVTLANCCKPVFGDEIIGYITKGNGVSVHKTDCANVKEKNDRIVSVSWNNTREVENYIARLLVKTDNDDNNVLDIVTKCSQRGLSIEAINTNNNIDYEVLVKVPNVKKLSLFMTDLKKLNFVKEVDRVNK